NWLPVQTGSQFFAAFNKSPLCRPAATMRLVSVNWEGLTSKNPFRGGSMRNVKWLVAAGLVVSLAGCVDTNGYPTTSYGGYPGYAGGYPSNTYGTSGYGYNQ